ncbi:hypothetical protein OS242_08515 [Tumebacillus sp. DT12]|uniref:Uncharacterized protein n=1 Tax=Tumebacillus lacus TaxID=2995335 RepID=A0ABT3X334_9BACL|nr:hypothetical protein [Tumebacillus lacus]MCX7570006.1 hypothetical protein [Tumebacillus lacus]
MTNSETFYSTYRMSTGTVRIAVFTDINDKDGFEISLGMYRAHVGDVTDEVFERHVEKFNGRITEGKEDYNL